MAAMPAPGRFVQRTRRRRLGGAGSFTIDACFNEAPIRTL